MQLEIVSPERVLLKGNVSSVTLPGVDGKFQLLNNHAPIISVLSEGHIRLEMKEEDMAAAYRPNFSLDKDKKWTLEISGGVLEMNNNKAIILVD